MSFQPDLLKGKAALVTGGGTGICRGIALALAAHGCDVAIVSRKAEHLEPTAGELRSIGVQALALAAVYLVKTAFTPLPLGFQTGIPPAKAVAV